MKRAVVTGIVCALLVAGVAWATQTWRDNESMGGFGLTDPTHAGGGPLCVQYDNTGKLTSAGAPCGAGLGGSAGVSSVTGTALRVSALPTTGAVVVDTIGGFYSGAASGGNQDLGALTSGVDEIIQSGGVASMTTYQCVANEVQIGAASGGGLAQSSAFTFDPSGNTLLIDEATTPATVWVDAGTAAAQGGGFFRAYQSTFVVPSLAQHVAFGSDTGNGSLGVIVFGNSLVTSGGSGSVSLRGGGYDTAAEDILLDVNGAHFTDGRILMTEITAPATPASGILTCYGDNSSLNWACKDQLGNVKHGVRTTTATASQFFTAVSDSGQFSRAQPSYSDISGSPPDQGQVWVDAADAANNSPDYLANKLVASSTVALTPITSHDGLLQASVIPSGVGAALSYYTQQWATVRTSAFGTLSILSNKQTVIAVANGMDQGWAVTAAGGTSVPTTIAANFINFPVYFYGFGTLAHVALNVNILNLVSSGSGTGTIVIELFSQNLGNPGTAANYTSLGSVSQSFTAAGATFFMGLNTTLSALSAGGLVLAVYRSDSTSTLTVSNGIAFTATLVASNP